MRILLALLVIFITPLHAIDAPKLVEAARRQIGVTVSYDPAYTSLAYPAGDVAREKGVCTDVIIRALRDAFSLDLQKLVHEDMKANFSAYPPNWNLRRPDANIDHRRVPNLRKYFARRGYERPLPAARDFSLYQPGDIVTVTVSPQLPHIMLISDKKTVDGRPLVIHNIGRGTVEEDQLATFPITGFYRLK